jgi:phosphoglycerate kinase
MNLKTIEDLGNLSGKRVLLRLDFNVPVANGSVTEGFRIDSALPTISALRAQGAKIGIVSHIENEEGATLVPVFEYINKKTPISFVLHLPDLADALERGAPGSVIMMENIRQYEGEKKNDPDFSKQLASIADVYIDDAFSVAHRTHASVVGVASLLPSAAGPLLINEITELSKAFNATKPFLFVLGGAKFETKLPLIEKFIDKADTIFVGGALGNDLLRARGVAVGTSKLSKTAIDLSRVATTKNVLAPIDAVVQTPTGKAVRDIHSIGPDESIVDIGPKTSALLAQHLSQASFVLWNGPLGYFEGGFGEGTDEFAKNLASLHRKMFSIIGGGDTLAAIEHLAIQDQFSFVSTGGGAMLDFLGSGTLPALETLKK